MSSDSYVIGIDVGTSSVRGGLFTKTGKLLKSHSISIKIFTPLPEYFEQSSEEIWDAACSCVREITEDIAPESVKGIGFDATCSLVAIGRNGTPVTVSPDLNPKQNVVMWMDHRAVSQTQRINQLDKKYFKSVGGSISLEMQVPKLLWLKENLPQDCWEKAERFFDLPDFLTWRACGSDSRSLCSVVCKWLYNASPDIQEWNKELYTRAGIEELLEDSDKIGHIVRAPGELCGGLTEDAAKSMGLQPGTPVATSIIDAHAGGIGMIGCICDGVSQNITTRLSLICGTSTCHMAVSTEPLFCPGVWGPYYSAMVPGLWLNEAGQSAAGKVLDHLIDSHEVAVKLKEKLGGNEEVVKYLNTLLEKMAARKGTMVDLLTEDVHVWPDFHGNRSPVADPTLKGMMSGLTLSQGEEAFALLYLAAIQALTYGTQHILEVLKSNGYSKLETLLLCGGLSKNPLFVQTHANALPQSILVPERSESVLLGAAMLGGTAGKLYPDLRTALQEMAGRAKHILPVKDVLRYHERKYKVFKRMLADQLAYREIMKQ